MHIGLQHSKVDICCAHVVLCSFFKETGVVVKSLHPWQRFRQKIGVDLPQLRTLYTLTKQLPNLVHSTSGPALEGDTYTVELEPVGLTPASAAPTNELQTAYAALGGLRGLWGLHNVSH